MSAIGRLQEIEANISMYKSSSAAMRECQLETKTAACTVDRSINRSIVTTTTTTKLTIKLMPTQDLQIGAFKIDSNGRVDGQTVVKVINGLFEHVGTPNLFDKFGLVNFVTTVQDTHVARVVSFGRGAVGRHDE